MRRFFIIRCSDSMDGEAVYDVFILTRRSGAVDIDQVARGIDMDGIREIVPAGAPVCLWLDLSRVVFRAVEEEMPATDQDILQKHFPDIPVDTLRYEFLTVGGSIKGIYLIRKSILDCLAASFYDGGYYPVGYALAGASVGVLTPLIDDEAVIDAGHVRYKVGVFGVEVTDDLPADEVVSLSGQLVEGKYLVPLAIWSQWNTARRAKEAVVFYYRAFLKRRFSVLSVVIVSLLCLFVLMVNTFFYQHYYRANELSASLNLEQQEELSKQKNELEQKIGRQKKLFSENHSVQSRKSLLLADIGSSVPAQIVLKAMNIDPVLKYDPKKKVETDARMILIQGVSLGSPALSLWVERLGELPWAEDITIERIGQGRESMEFRLNIKYREP